MTRHTTHWCHGRSVSGPVDPDGCCAGEAEAVAGFLDRALNKRRVRLIVEADLDPVPGWGDNADDWQALTQRLLDDAVGHYNPTVAIAVAALDPRGQA